MIKHSETRFREGVFIFQMAKGHRELGSSFEDGFVGLILIKIISNKKLLNQMIMHCLYIYDK